MSKHEVAVELAGGKRLVFETGRMAKQASGALPPHVSQANTMKRGFYVQA